MHAGWVLVELSSDDESPQKKKKKPTHAGDVVCLDNEPEQSTSTKKIAITIGDPLRHRTVTLQDQNLSKTKSTKITIQIEDTDTETPPELNSVHRKPVLFSQPLQSTSQSEFIPLFTEFIELCELLDSSSDMRQVVEKKLKHYYLKADDSFKSSVELKQLLRDKMTKIKIEINKMWIHIKHVVDELKKHKKVVTMETALSNSEDPVNSETASQITRLEEKIATLRNTIQELEEQEVDFEKEDQSAYLRAEKCKNQLVETYSQLCSMRKVQPASFTPVELDRRYGRHQGPVAKLEEWVNKPIKSGCPPRFPDFLDVVRCVKEASQQDHLLWTEHKVLCEARELFAQCGRALQRKRQRREWRLVTSRLTDWTDETDPADSDVHLASALSRNRILARQREEEVFDEFEKKEMMLKIRKDNSNKAKSKDSQEATTIPDNTTAANEINEVPADVKRVRPDLITEDTGGDSDCCVLTDEDSCSSDSSDSSEEDGAMVLSDDEAQSSDVEYVEDTVSPSRAVYAAKNIRLSVCSDSSDSCVLVPDT